MPERERLRYGLTVQRGPAAWKVTKSCEVRADDPRLAFSPIVQPPCPKQISRDPQLTPSLVPEQQLIETVRRIRPEVVPIESAWPRSSEEILADGAENEQPLPRTREPSGLVRPPAARQDDIRLVEPDIRE